jgi:hypothetical protein
MRLAALALAATLAGVPAAASDPPIWIRRAAKFGQPWTGHPRTAQPCGFPGRPR